jgi:hypothetical protein
VVVCWPARVAFARREDEDGARGGYVCPVPPVHETPARCHDADLELVMGVASARSRSEASTQQLDAAEGRGMIYQNAVDWNDGG